MRLIFTIFAIFLFCFGASAEKRDPKHIDRQARARALEQLKQEQQRRQQDDELSRSFSTVPLARTTYRIVTANGGEDPSEFEKREKVRRFQCQQTGENCTLDEKKE